MKWMMILALVMITIAHSTPKGKNKRRSKVMACLGLTNERVEQDKKTFAKMAGKMDEKLGGQDYLAKMHEMLLINCYQEITDPLTERILKEMRAKKLNVFDKDYQQLMLPKQMDPSKTDMKKLEASIAEVNQILQELKAEEEKKAKQASGKDNEKKNPPKKADPNAKWEYDQYEDELTWKDLLSITKFFHYTGLDTYCGMIISTLILLIIIKKKNQQASKSQKGKEDNQPSNSEQSNEAESNSDSPS